MAAESRLIVASARLPVTVTRRQDGWEATQNPGGLVTALKAEARRRVDEGSFFGHIAYASLVARKATA